MFFLKAVQVVLIPYRGNPTTQMLGVVLGVLGIFLLLAVRDPAAHRSLIAYGAWSTVAHAGLMLVQVMRGVLHRWELSFYIPGILIGIVLIFLVPARPPDKLPK
jgi:hypothetical protein